MEPSQQPQSPNVPPITPAQQPPQQGYTPNKMTKRTKVALWLLIAPTALLILSIVGFAFTNYLTATAEPSNSESLFASQPAGATAINAVLFLTTGISILTWLPGIITGIVLLATRPQTPRPPTPFN